MTSASAIVSVFLFPAFYEVFSPDGIMDVRPLSAARPRAQQDSLIWGEMATVLLLSQALGREDGMKTRE